jgi:hypothetical protein
MAEETEEITIDRSKYDPLDNASLGMLIREFLYRNEAFMNEFRELDEKRASRDEVVRFAEKYGCFPGPFQASQPRPAILLPPMRAVRIMPKGRPTLSLAESHKAVLKTSAPRRLPTMVGISKNRKEGRPSDPEQLCAYLFFEPGDSGDYTTGDCVVVRINLKRSKERIKEEIDDILDVCRPGEQKRTRPEWKYYLIAYDLKEDYPSLTDNAIAYILNKAYPKVSKQLRKKYPSLTDDDFADIVEKAYEKGSDEGKQKYPSLTDDDFAYILDKAGRTESTIADYLRQASYLINKGYKEYL